MWPCKFDLTPALAEVVLTNRATQAGVAATLVRLASQGWILITQRVVGGYEVRPRLHSPSQPAPSDANEHLLLRWISDVARGRSVASRGGIWWPQWETALERQAITAGVPKEAWRHLRRWRGIPLLARRGLPRNLLARWRRYAADLKGYPNHADPLPGTRQEWDAVLAYATALGTARSFLRRTREICEYYERNFQGIVITFFTPRWYVHRRIEGEGRFAFLTQGLGNFLACVDLSRLRVGEPIEMSEMGVVA